MKGRVVYIAFFFLTACGNYSRGKALEFLKPTSMRVEDSIRHYYPIVRGSKLYTSFRFFNTGKEPLAIREVQTSCGCIVVDFPDFLVFPDKFGYITVEYDSNKNIGFVEGYIDIYANLDTVFKHTIKFDVNVVTDADYTRDYEELYEKYLEEHESSLKKGTEASATQQGYFTELGGEMKY